MKWWRYLRAVTLLPLKAVSDIAVLGCLLDHANPTTGQCYPCQQLIANETGIPLRTVERAIVRLVGTSYLSKERRGRSSNAYHVNWKALEGVDAAYEERRRINSRKWNVTGDGTESRNVPLPTAMTVSTPSQVAVHDPSQVWSKKENLQKENLKRKHEVVDCKQSPCAVSPIRGRRQQERDEEQGAITEAAYRVAEQKVRHAISVHPKKDALEATFLADAQLYYEAVHVEAARSGGGNAFLWTIAKGQRQAVPG